MLISPGSAQSQSAAAPPSRIWTAEIKVRFLDRLAINGNARAACRAVGFSPESAYRQRRCDPLFARGWASAVLKGRENNAQVLADRAIDGVEEEVWYRGELVGTRRRYDNRLLLAHLARLESWLKSLTTMTKANSKKSSPASRANCRRVPARKCPIPISAAMWR